MAARILIVDDEAPVARTMQRSMNLRGYRATAVYSYDEAVAILEREAFDLGLIDYIMPGGGIALCRYIRKHYLSPSPKRLTV